MMIAAYGSFRYTKIDFQQRIWIFKPQKNRDDNLRTAGIKKAQS
jgi:hypothetical protein